MLLFNEWICLCRYIALQISIHLMLLFNIYCNFIFLFNEKFQYISCYCSTLDQCQIMITLLNFNTSHVTVQHQSKKQLRLFVLISIHLMLLFNKFWKDKGGALDEFQYISCYCSTKIGPYTYQARKEFQYISCYCSTIR